MISVNVRFRLCFASYRDQLLYHNVIFVVFQVKAVALLARTNKFVLHHSSLTIIKIIAVYVRLGRAEKTVAVSIVFMISEEFWGWRRRRPRTSDWCRFVPTLAGRSQAKAGSGYYFELTCDHGNQAEAKNFCESRGGWLAEPRSQVLVNIIKPISKKWVIATFFCEYYYNNYERTSNFIFNIVTPTQNERFRTDNSPEFEPTKTHWKLFWAECRSKTLPYRGGFSVKSFHP